MKRFLKLFSIFALLFLVVAFAFACGEDKDKEKNKGETLDGEYNITVWVSEIAGVKELTEQQIKDFMTANPGIKLNATVEKVGEGEAATQMITSVEDGADLFCFAQDQLARLVQAGALNPLGEQAKAAVTADNDAGAVGAATVNDKVYCYPLTSDNGFFMYYDKRVITDESKLGSLEDLIAICEAAGKKFSFNLEGSGWYNASFFFATGCHTTWNVDDSGAFVSVDDDFNSDNGLIALKGMQKLLKSSCYIDSSNGADFDSATPSAIVISGTWDSNTISEILGENMGCAQLPSFTVDGKTYHLGSFSGNKLMGVKPQTDVKRAAVLQKLALYLTSEKCQNERFEAVGWGPSNLKAQQSEGVQNSVTLKALAAQSPYAKPERKVHGSWWDISKTYATAAKKASTDDDLRAALKSYEDAIKGLFSQSTDEKEAFTVIGKFGENNWNADVEMEQKPAGTWMTKEPIEFAAGDEFQVRQGKAWDVQFGKVGEDGKSTKDNFVIETAGKYYVKLVFDKDAGTGVVSIEKVNPNYGWTVIGAFGENNWNADVYMEPDAEGIWKTTEAIEFAANNEFKVRYGLSWDVSYGDGTANYKVAEAGSYYVQFNPETQAVTLVPAE